MRNTSRAVLHKLFLVTGWIRMEKYLVFGIFPLAAFPTQSAPQALPSSGACSLLPHSSTSLCPLTHSSTCLCPQTCSLPGLSKSSQIVFSAVSKDGSSECCPVVSPELTPLSWVVV